MRIPSTRSSPSRSGNGTGSIGAAALVGVALTGAALVLAASLPTHARRADGTAAGRTTRNAVVHWNSVATAAFAPTEGTNPMAQSRALAILHAAIHDALNAIEPRFQSYTAGLAPSPHASPDAAVAAAAREVLVTLVPDQTARVEAAYAEALTSERDATRKAAGVALGQAAARATLARRQGDRFDAAGESAYVPRSGTGEYQFTPPFDFAALPQLGSVEPFVITLEEHRVNGPLPVSSPEYGRDLAYVRDIGGLRSTVRTAEQSEIARFWYEDSPLGWNRIANTILRTHDHDMWTAARALALVNFAMADGFIAGFDAKYEWRFWRPVTALHAAADDGNPLTQADETWEPFMPTPPVPDHPSTHTVLGWAAAEVLAAICGDEVTFDATSLTLPGVTRRFTSVRAAADENGRSRVYAGIHFQHAVAEGRRQGQRIGQVVARALPAFD